MEEAHRQGYRSLAAVPFRLKGQIIGVLTLCSGEPDAFSDEESEQLALLGTTLSSALDLLDKKTLQRRAGKGSHGSWERTQFLAGGIESASVPFVAVFPDGSTGAVNAALCAMLGYTEDELLALPLTRLFPDGTTADEERFMRVITTKMPGRYESTTRTKDGTLLPVECFLQAMTDETSGQPCTYAFIADISDRKQQMDLLEEERQQYMAFFETASAAIVVTTPEGSVLAANPAACRLFGRTEEALRSADGGGLAGTGDPRFVELARTCKENGTAQGELRLIREDGMQFDAAVRAAWIKAKNGQAALNLTLWGITGQKLAGAALNQDRNGVVSLLDSLPNPLRRSNPDGESVFFNKAWLAFTGRVPADEWGDGWMEGIHPDDRDRYRETSREQDNRLTQVEYRLRNNAGEYRWLREIRIPDPSPDGTETGITYSCFDIHECRLAEEALEEARAHYRAMFENTTDATLLVSDRILDCNAAAIRLFAGIREDLIGHDIQDFFPRYQPDGRVSADAAREYLEAARETPQTFPWVTMRTDGTTRETCVTLTTLSIHGEEQVLVVIKDMTGRKQAEREIQRLTTYPDMNPNPVIEVRPDRTITYTNPAAAAVLSSLGLPDDPAAFLPTDFDAVVTTLNPAEPMRIMRIVHLKERSFNESISSAPGQDAIRIYAYDITDRVQAMEALAYANHKLGILTSITRHDIQNKLTGVLGYLDLIRSSLRDPRLIGFLDKAETSANAIRHHIDFTKDYESLGGTAPVWQEITSILAEVRSHFDAGEIAFEEPAPGFAVFADPMFGKVLYNLCDNSLRHGVHVRHIRIRSEPADAGCTLIYEDDGVGIPQDKKELIFERGFTTSSGSAKTSGLGLFLVRDILAITGISIKETGVPGAGSRFEMVIPPGKWRCGPVE
jgi:PAS domain S-box-containing protein